MFWQPDPWFGSTSLPVFNFSLKLEETILQVLPLASFILFASASFLYYRQSNARIRQNKLLCAKWCVTLVLITLEFASLFLRRSSILHTETTYWAASLDFAAALAVAAVVYIERRHAIRTSALLGLYLAIGTVIDVTKSRSYFLCGLTTSGVVATTTAAVRFLLVVLEEIPKTSLIIDTQLHTISDGDATSGFFSRALFFVLRTMLRAEYRGALVLDDLSGLGVELGANALFYALSDHWAASRRASKHSFFVSCCKTWKWAIILILIPRLCLTGFVYSQPFAMNAVISHIAEPNDGEEGEIAAFVVLAFGGAAIFRAASIQAANRLVTQVRGGLISHLVDKSYRLKISEAKKQTAITMMDADYEIIAAGIPACVEVPFAIIEACLGMYFLAHFMKLACSVVFVPLILAPLLGHAFGNHSASAVACWNDCVEKRVTKTAHVISQLPAIKSLGLGPKMAEYIQHFRVGERAAFRKQSHVQVGLNGSSVLVDQLTPVLVVAAGLFTRVLDDNIEPTIIYPALGVLTLVKAPLADLLRVYPRVMSMLACFERVQQFLSQDEHEDRRIVSRTPTVAGHKYLPSFGSRATLGNVVHKKAFPVFRFEKASIAPRGSDKPILSNMDFSISNGSVTIMFGPTSSGKTTFLESLLGEAEVLDGKLYINEAAMHIAVCSQEVSLPNATVRDCIVGACKYEPAWFNVVIEYCKLVEDLQQLPNGEHYVINSGGTGLSGGQRQRISIARSVYARTGAIILDDVFSSLDKSTAIEILKGLCGQEGLLRQLNCTVVLSSYLPECLDVADNVLLLDGSGSISCETCEPKGKVHAQVAYLLRQGLLGEKEDAPTEETPIANQAKHEPAKPTGGFDRLDESRQKRDKSLYLLWIDSIGRISVSLFVFLMLFVGASDSLPNIFLRFWIEVAPANKKYLIGYAVLSVSTGLFCYIGLAMMIIKLGSRASDRLYTRLTSVITQATLGFLSTADSGPLMNLHSNDVEVLSRRLANTTYTSLYFSFGTLAHMCPILAGATYMVAAFPLVGFCILRIQRHHLHTNRQLQLLQTESQAPLVSLLRDIGTGLIYIRGSGTQEHHFSRCLYLLDQSQKPYYYLRLSRTLLSLGTELVVALMALILAALALHVKGSTSPNAVGLAFLNLIFIGSAFTSAVGAWTKMETSIDSLAGLRNFLRDTPTEKKTGATCLPQNWPSRGEIIFSNVAARYQLDNDNEQPAVLHNIDFRIEPGKKIGVMGRTGSGKSSLLNSLLGFLDYDGNITIDGVEVKSAHPDELRSRIVTISQDLVELDGTIRDNLLPYDKSWVETKPDKLSAEQVQEAERKDEIVRETLVRLGIWDQAAIIGGLDAILEKVSYSFGDKQLLCIARAVVRRRLTGSRLVLIDEATASVDNWREQIVREMMVEYFRGCTIVAVAHREESIADSNRTIHMANGHIESIDNYDLNQD